MSRCDDLAEALEKARRAGDHEAARDVERELRDLVRFGGHEFVYQQVDDLFQCIHCDRFERVLRRPDATIPDCEGAR